SDKCANHGVHDDYYLCCEHFYDYDGRLLDDNPPHRGRPSSPIRSLTNGFCKLIAQKAFIFIRNLIYAVLMESSDYERDSIHSTISII
uniref:Uncharacterized protein n=1 Tax=Parascaris univalens TaxID=6257 RepID=A0A915AKJ8_PARUN